MDKVKDTGQKIDKIRKESGLNAKRISENFLQPHRTVENFNKITPHLTTFTATPGSSAILNLKVTEFPILCTVNPPLLHISTDAAFSYSNPGSVTSLASSNLIDPPNNDFVLAGGGVQVPVDGCYSVFWTSNAWGMGYFDDKVVNVTITRIRGGSVYGIRTVGQTPTGVLILFGPGIYCYAPASPVWAVVECMAGDIISAALTENDIGQTYPWIGGGLGGFFSAGLGDSNMLITLIAEFET